MSTCSLPSPSTEILRWCCRLETNLGPSAAGRTSRQSRCQDKRALEDARHRGTHLATTLLQFRWFHSKEARGKAALHASQSSCPRVGAGASTMEPEQLLTRRWRTRASSGE